MRSSGAVCIRDLERILAHAFRASRVGRYCPVMIWGDAGIGKSDTVAKVARDLGIGFKDLRLGLFEAPDLLGVFRQQEVYPCHIDFEEGALRAARGRLYTRYALFARLWDRHRDRVADLGGPDKIVDWAIAEARRVGLGHLFSVRTMNSPPSWLPQPGTRGILFLDELNRANREVRQGSFQLVLDRTVGQIPLPDGWIIVSANNPPDMDGKGMGHQVNAIDDRALLSRFCHVAAEPRTSEWLGWARRAGVDARIRAFIEMNGGDMLGSNRPTALPDLDPTPRSWAMLSKLVLPVPSQVPGAPPYVLDEDLVSIVSTGLVGVEATRTWFALRMVPDPIVTVVDLMESYSAGYARLEKFLSYPIYDPATGEPRKNADGEVLLSKRSDLVRVAFETFTDELRAMTAKDYNSEPGFHPEFGDLKLVCTALKLATDAYRSPEQGGLGMTDVSTQYLKLWMGDPRSSGRQCVKTNMIGQIGSPAIEAAASAVGLTKDMVVETIREFGALIGRRNALPSLPTTK